MFFSIETECKVFYYQTSKNGLRIPSKDPIDVPIQDRRLHSVPVKPNRDYLLQFWKQLVSEFIKDVGKFKHVEIADVLFHRN